MMGHSESENKKREGGRERTIHISHRKEVISFALMTACMPEKGWVEEKEGTNATTQLPQPPTLRNTL